MIKGGPEFKLTTDTVEIWRRRDEADAILTTVAKPTEGDFRRALALVTSTIKPPPDWRGYPKDRQYMLK